MLLITIKRRLEYRGCDDHDHRFIGMIVNQPQFTGHIYGPVSQYVWPVKSFDCILNYLILIQQYCILISVAQAHAIAYQWMYALCTSQVKIQQ